MLSWLVEFAFNLSDIFLLGWLKSFWECSKFLHWQSYCCWKYLCIFYKPPSHISFFISFMGLKQKLSFFFFFFFFFFSTSSNIVTCFIGNTIYNCTLTHTHFVINVTINICIKGSNFHLLVQFLKFLFSWLHKNLFHKIIFFFFFFFSFLLSNKFQKLKLPRIISKWRQNWCFLMNYICILFLTIRRKT